LSVTTEADDRTFGLLLFEAEESLARGAPDKSLVLASKAVKERPESLIARSLFERARREILQGRRREKLESRLREAEGLVAGGDLIAAEKIVASALKLLPDHETALKLLGRIREERTRGHSAEAEAEVELLRLAGAQAQKAAEAAREALAQGWNRRAFLQIRRGLRLMPDHPELLALLRETQGALEQLAAERTRRRALLAQLRDGLELLSAGDVEASLRILRAVLDEDPDNVRAQAAVQEIRERWLRRSDVAQRPALQPPAARRPLRIPSPAPRQPAPRAPGEPKVPIEILLPRTRRRATPIGLVLGGAAAVLGVLLVLAGRGGRPLATSRGAAPALSPPPVVTTAATTTPGPLTDVEPALSASVRATLRDYAKALESADAGLLERARPDLSHRERAEKLSPFVGALNASADMRVLDARVVGDEATVTILATFVIVGRQDPKPPVEETLLFVRRAGAWHLSGRRSAGSP
jgi:tetratricopeptide (TPR) repeat protein